MGRNDGTWLDEYLYHDTDVSQAIFILRDVAVHRLDIDIARCIPKHLLLSPPYIDVYHDLPAPTKNMIQLYRPAASYRQTSYAC